MMRDGRVQVLFETTPLSIGAGTVLLGRTDGGEPATIDADFVLLMTGYRQNTTLFDMLGVDMQGADRQPRYDPETMETNVPGLFIAGTAVAGTPLRRVSVIVETCHVHIPRIVKRLTGMQVEQTVTAREDD